MKFKGIVVLFSVMVVLVMAGSAVGQEKPFLWNGNQWPQLPFDAKVGYVKGVGNLADFENGVTKGKSDYIARVFADELKNKSVSQVIEQIDKFYKENPGKLDTSVLEVIVMRCTKYCPPGMGTGVKK